MENKGSQLVRSIYSKVGFILLHVIKTGAIVLSGIEPGAMLLKH